MNYKKLAIPSYAFDPYEPWSMAFRRGLSKIDFNNKYVYEVGVGSGAVARYLISAYDVNRVYGSDLDPRLIPLSVRNIRRLSDRHKSSFIPIYGSTNLLNLVERGKGYEVIARGIFPNLHYVVAYLPQIAEPLTLSPLHIFPDHWARYYDHDLYSKSQFNAHGLGVIESLLRQTRKWCPQATVVLCLAGRPGGLILESLFSAHGYQFDIVHTEVVQQCPKTSILSYVQMEAESEEFIGNEIIFEFFLDECCRYKITATQAHLTRGYERKPIYHRLHVIKGEPIKC